MAAPIPIPPMLQEQQLDLPSRKPPSKDLSWLICLLFFRRHHPFNGRRSSNRGGAPDYALYVQ
ncbi:hypothetical protein ASPTUDRAFT_43655 [Aspergillus tubingensis CBS 134.48]|uniref:Uncharacterized protein n=1 Tax=Aspergillus tubingensis (strain CBS 134.48) TaxID=767770 RepID=A0A1L9N5L5_ASPTC|nr:hypothetical protein ASPTUDRAFT_43655 [Aspergillus tubingensis CBS 134.48]